MIYRRECFSRFDRLKLFHRRIEGHIEAVTDGRTMPLSERRDDEERPVTRLTPESDDEERPVTHSSLGEITRSTHPRGVSSRGSTGGTAVDPGLPASVRRSATVPPAVPRDRASGQPGLGSKGRSTRSVRVVVTAGS
jgi:hypothetical protein